MKRDGLAMITVGFRRRVTLRSLFWCPSIIAGFSSFSSFPSFLTRGESSTWCNFCFDYHHKSSFLFMFSFACITHVSAPLSPFQWKLLLTLRSEYDKNVYIRCLLTQFDFLKHSRTITVQIMMQNSPSYTGLGW